MESIKFITPEKGHCYIEALAKHLDIEFEPNMEKIKHSNKCLIVWNHYAYLMSGKERHKRKHELYEFFKKNNKPAYVVERGSLPNTLIIDKYGFLYDSKAFEEGNWGKPLETYEAGRIENFIDTFTRSPSSLEPQADRITIEEFNLKLKLPYKFKVFVPMQVRNDTVNILWCDWVKDIKNFQNIIKILANELQDVIFIVKNHPVEDSPEYRMKPSKNIVIADYVHYKDCIAYSDAVLTIHSSVGLQALMWRKPVITLGKCFYNHPSLTEDADGFEKLFHSLHFRDIIVPDSNIMKRFFYFLKYNYYTDCQMRKLAKRRSEPTKISRIVFEHPYKKEIIIKEV